MPDKAKVVISGHKNNFKEPHRKLKAAIHRCQYEAYKNEKVTLDKSEEEARLCMQPLLFIRRHASVLIDN